jgi:hypothetical protein
MLNSFIWKCLAIHVDQSIQETDIVGVSEKLKVAPESIRNTSESTTAQSTYQGSGSMVRPAGSGTPFFATWQAYRQCNDRIIRRQFAI